MPRQQINYKINIIHLSMAITTACVFRIIKQFEVDETGTYLIKTKIHPSLLIDYTIHKI